MDSKLRCVFELPAENAKPVSTSLVPSNRMLQAGASVHAIVCETEIRAGKLFSFL